MSRLIDAKSAKMVLEWNLVGDNADVASILIDTVPTIDAVPVVRCKECIYYMGDKGNERCERFEYHFPDDDDFCSWCVRKDGDE